MSQPDLSRPRRVHIVGLGGAGMSAIATVLVAMGHEVSGSDLKDGLSLQRLRALGVDVAIGHNASNVAAAEFVAISSADSRSSAARSGSTSARAMAASSTRISVRTIDAFGAGCSARRRTASSARYDRSARSS